MPETQQQGIYRNYESHGHQIRFFFLFGNLLYDSQTPIWGSSHWQNQNRDTAIIEFPNWFFQLLQWCTYSNKYECVQYNMADYNFLKWISSDHVVTLLTTRTSLDIKRSTQTTLHLKSRFTTVMCKIILMEYTCILYTAKWSVPLRGICILAPEWVLWWACGGSDGNSMYLDYNNTHYRQLGGCPRKQYFGCNF